MIAAEPWVLVLLRLTGILPPRVIVRGSVPGSLTVWPCPVIVKCAVGPACGAVTVILAVRLPPPYVAVTVTVAVCVKTVLLCAEKLALLWPAAIV